MNSEIQRNEESYDQQGAEEQLRQHQTSTSHLQINNTKTYSSTITNSTLQGQHTETDMFQQTQNRQEEEPMSTQHIRKRRNVRQNQERRDPAIEDQIIKERYHQKYPGSSKFSNYNTRHEYSFSDWANIWKIDT
jgi:hypothetical protein